MKKLLAWAGAIVLLGTGARAQKPVPAISGVFGSPVTFATHAELHGYGFSFGPSDGQFGAIPAGGNSYTFYGAAGSTAACAGTKNAKGAFSFIGTLDHVTGSNGCTRLFGPGDAPAGWVFDTNYAGGGQVVRFASGGKSGWLMVFHGEYWWQNPATTTHKCDVVGGSGSQVECFYASLGLAVSTDNGKMFKVAGQILQPSQPLSVFTGGGTNMNVGYGSLVVADANGKHLDNPPADASSAYFYLFYLDLLPRSPGVCNTAVCMGVARAPYADVVAAALSGDPHQVARVFHKYDGASPNPWTQPATSDTPNLSGTAGKYTPLWTDEPGGAEVIYDSAFDVYLAVYQSGGGIKVRASSDLIHWSGAIGAPYSEPGRTLYYPTLMGETGDPTIGGAAPRVYFSSFPTGLFPDYTTAVFESVTLTLSLAPGSTPAIGLVANAEGESPVIAPNTWVEIKGVNLAPAGSTRIWQVSDFANNVMPTQLSGVSATVNGRAAYVYYISPTQVNILTPPDAMQGEVPVQVTNNGAASAAWMVLARTESPSFFVFNGGPYVAAEHADGSFLGPANLYAGLTTPAKPGETVVLYANGFGPTSAPIVSGSATQGGTLSPLPVIKIGGITATVQFAGLVGPGEFQFNVVVPAGLPDGDNALTATHNGFTTESGVLLTVQH
jgi:uncharacterized protein (TIGR03437 family)